jgi:hypothetical protein
MIAILILASLVFVLLGWVASKALMAHAAAELRCMELEAKLEELARRGRCIELSPEARR